MAKILGQGIKPITKDLEVFVPEMEAIEGKMLAEILGVFNAFLFSLLKKKEIELKNIEEDIYGNPFISLEYTRISLAIALVTKNGICVYDRKGTELNFNDKLDVIGSVGYGTPSLFFKISSEMWKTKVISAKIAENYAWEITDCVGDKKLVQMPIIILEMEEGVFSTIQVEDIREPTSKMQVVLEHLLNK